MIRFVRRNSCLMQERNKAPLKTQKKAVEKMSSEEEKLKKKLERYGGLAGSFPEASDGNVSESKNETPEPSPEASDNHDLGNTPYACTRANTV